MTAQRSDPCTVGDVTSLLEQAFPPDTAESWDAVGLVCGDPAANVRRVLLTVDVTGAVVDQARDLEVQLLIAHHPLLLRAVHSVAVTTPKGKIITDLITKGVALYCAHTNADIWPGGTADVLARTLGVDGAEPLRRTQVDQTDKIVTFVPADHVDAVVDALCAAGAGTIGDYERCYFAAEGTGSFRPGPATDPYIGGPGQVESVPEQRVELVAPRGRRPEILAALHGSHPYEEPAVDVIELADRPGPGGLGRIGRLAQETTLEAFVQRVAAALPATASGVRVAGDPARPIRTVAVQAGAGDDLLDAARAAGADVYVTSDLRHHPASEALEWPGAPALVDIPHWAAEWTWLPQVKRLATDALPVQAEISRICTDPWQWRG